MVMLEKGELGMYPLVQCPPPLCPLHASAFQLPIPIVHPPTAPQWVGPPSSRRFSLSLSTHWMER